MKLISKKYTLMVLAAIILMIMFVMGTNLFNRKQKSPRNRQFQEIRTQSNSTEPQTIEQDLMETDLSNLDKELQDIERELEQVE